MIIVLDDGPCACCERHPRGCTDGPSGPCCPCCGDTGREFWPYENQEAARVFAAAALATAQTLVACGEVMSYAARKTVRKMAAEIRATIHVVGVLEEVELPGAFCVAEIVEVSM